MINLEFALNVLEYLQKLQCTVWFVFNVFIIEIWLSETHTITDNNSRNAPHTSMLSNRDVYANYKKKNNYLHQCIVLKSFTL